MKEEYDITVLTGQTINDAVREKNNVVRTGQRARLVEADRGSNGAAKNKVFIDKVPDTVLFCLVTDLMKLKRTYIRGQSPNEYRLVRCRDSLRFYRIEDVYDGHLVVQGANAAAAGGPTADHSAGPGMKQPEGDREGPPGCPGGRGDVKNKWLVWLVCA
jgi:hypothetical protein